MQMAQCTNAEKITLFMPITNNGAFVHFYLGKLN